MTVVDTGFWELLNEFCMSPYFDKANSKSPLEFQSHRGLNVTIKLGSSNGAGFLG